MRATVIGVTMAGAIIAMVQAAGAQSLTPEELRAQIDQRVQTLNPYAELLNDPDPARSLAAMQIMMESGDPELERMAREFGLLSPNPQVQRAALEAFLATGPVFSVRFDGSSTRDDQFTNQLRNAFEATVGPDKIAYWKAMVGEFSPGDGCYVYQNTNECFIAVNADGIFLSGRRYRGRARIDESGNINGSASIDYVEEPVPFSIQLID